MSLGKNLTRVCPPLIFLGHPHNISSKYIKDCLIRTFLSSSGRKIIILDNLVSCLSTSDFYFVSSMSSTNFRSSLRLHVVVWRLFVCCRVILRDEIVLNWTIKDFIVCMCWLSLGDTHSMSWRQKKDIPGISWKQKKRCLCLASLSPVYPTIIVRQEIVSWVIIIIGWCI